jgi:hypothetical protein
LLVMCRCSCLLWPCLFIYSSVKDSPPPLQHSGCPTLFATCLVVIAYYSVSLFSLVSVCPGGCADLAQGCLWEYCVPLSSPCGPHLPKTSGVWRLAAAWEPSSFLCSK